MATTPFMIKVNHRRTRIFVKTSGQAKKSVRLYSDNPFPILQK